VLRPIVALLMALAGVRTPTPAADDFWSKTPEQLQKGIENAHPATYYVLASKLFAAGRKDDAVFWFYVGQLRYRFHLQSNPGLPPDGDPALFGSLSEVVGRTLNEYAFGRLRTLRSTILRVLDWDEKTENGFTSKRQHATEWNAVRAGLRKLYQTLEQNADQIRRERTAHGLPNEE